MGSEKSRDHRQIRACPKISTARAPTLRVSAVTTRDTRCKNVRAAARPGALAFTGGCTRAARRGPRRAGKIFSHIGGRFAA
jgi:hypothetical protein